MTVFANTTIVPSTDGLFYAKQAIMPAAEADLWNLKDGTPDPTPIIYEAAVTASIEFSTQGVIPSNSSYVVLQDDLGDGVWYDLAWCVWLGTSGTANFRLSAGVGGANAFQQTRTVGTSPGSNGSIQCPLGGRIRFVGKSSIGGAGSSSSSGVVPAILVSIKYKLTPLR